MLQHVVPTSQLSIQNYNIIVTQCKNCILKLIFCSDQVLFILLLRRLNNQQTKTHLKSTVLPIYFNPCKQNLNEKPSSQKAGRNNLMKCIINPQLITLIPNEDLYVTLLI
ncbi:unnamed protein product [Paramecium octaurelia]|uniref:Uncharacterized protein n=1 Tax=Paramecium octaurelia TaxID=43137 RepID=A0A8S1YMY7_PAROT|nr:unnamed protein product [Paramecium octaurelia]